MNRIPQGYEIIINPTEYGTKENIMKKSDLRTDDTVIYANGEIRKIKLNTRNGDVLVDAEGRYMNELKAYNDKFICTNFFNLNIVSIYSSKNNWGGERKLLWERKQTHTISIDGGKPHEVSYESFESIKDCFDNVE